MKLWKPLLCVLALLAPWTVEAQSEKAEEETLGKVRKLREVEAVPAIIGMQAYSEVLASGRYLVGPGDEFMVYVSNMQEEEPIVARVQAEGGLFIPLVGLVKVGGLRLSAARAAVEEAFRRSVKVGGISLELSKPRLFPVTVVGVVAAPGNAWSSGVERISEVIDKVGGLGSAASRRNIRVIKKAHQSAENLEQVLAMAQSGKFGPYEGLESTRVDLVLYGMTGDSRYNPFVEDGDIVFVPPSGGRVSAMGALRRPASYELVEGERISDLLTLAMGPAPNFDKDNVLLFRYEEDRAVQFVHSVDIEGVLSGKPEADLPLQADDWLVVRAISDYHKESTVNILGEVMHEGHYVVEKGKTTLRDIVERAGGFTEDASLQGARVVRPPASGEEVKDPEFERIRTIPVADRTEDQDQYFIMKSRERPGHMVVDFVALFEEGDESQNILLRPGDVIIVPTLQQVVLVSGQAAHPGAVIYNPDFSIWDYIERAGGLAWRASKDVRVIKVRTGETKRARDVERIEPGDRIWIKEKPQRNYWAIFAQGMGVVGQLATVILVFAAFRR